MKYELFLFDADDTLLDFKASELQAFTSAMRHHGHQGEVTDLYYSYNEFSKKLWSDVEKGTISKDFLKGERFRLTFDKHELNLPSDDVGETYLDKLPDFVVMIGHAVEVCQELKKRGARIGIVTNGFEKVQTRRLNGSPLKPYVDYLIVSENAGFAKPDIRFFDYAATQIGNLDKKKTLVIGDRLETDIEGARRFGVDSCWYNPEKQNPGIPGPTYHIDHLSKLISLIS